MKECIQNFKLCLLWCQYSRWFVASQKTPNLYLLWHINNLSWFRQKSPLKILHNGSCRRQIVLMWLPCGKIMPKSFYIFLAWFIAIQIYQFSIPMSPNQDTVRRCCPRHRHRQYQFLFTYARLHLWWSPQPLEAMLDSISLCLFLPRSRINLQLRSRPASAQPQMWRLSL